MSDRNDASGAAEVSPARPASLTDGGAIPERPRFGALRSLARRKLALVGAIIVLVAVLVAVLAPVLTPLDPADINIIERLKPFEGVKVTRLARGLPAGGSIAYSNASILSDALNERREI